MSVDMLSVIRYSLVHRFRTDVVLGDENITLTIRKLNCSVSRLWSETDSMSHNWSCLIFQIV